MSSGDIDHRELVEAVARDILQSITQQLTASGLEFRTTFNQSKSTDSVYIRVYTYRWYANKRRNIGVRIRVSDHGKGKSSRANFSRPAYRKFGFAFNMPRYRIARKLQHIVFQILERAKPENPVRRRRKGRTIKPP